MIVFKFIFYFTNSPVQMLHDSNKMFKALTDRITYTNIVSTHRYSS
jgi:hypothetical protein